MAGIEDYVTPMTNSLVHVARSPFDGSEVWRGRGVSYVLKLCEHVDNVSACGVAIVVVVG